MKNIIKIHLKKEDDYKNTYNDNILSYNLSNYILEELKGINPNQSIKFIISTDFLINEIDKDNLVDMIRNSFGNDISEIINLTKKQYIANILIFLIGFIFLIIYSLSNINLISEFILILCWVFLGESICSFLYKSIQNNYKIKRRKQIVTAKIVFE